MSKFTLTFLGTGGAQQVPAFGCQCMVCLRAREEPQYRRKPCSAMLEYNGSRTLIDAGLHDLTERFTPEQISQFLLTHYHMDHVQGLFPLRWGVGGSIPVYGPPDEMGCDDLFKHPGILDFNHTLTAFETIQLQGLSITPLPLNHSKLTFGYLFTTPHHRIAYLTDTAGLPEATAEFLCQQPPEIMIIDCSHEPRPSTPKNHSDLNTVIALKQRIGCEKIWLTHISHQFDAWMLENSLPEGIEAARDGLTLTADESGYY